MNLLYSVWTTKKLYLLEIFSVDLAHNSVVGKNEH